ncbi:hypothetical protein AAF712_002917 [Marasmius tenuissimus]|uniref:F-box-like domain protein n=1 Tax=Marasmius tenuissimus TaxID=585030 RepID=A0ABR3A7P5_9AGAR
MATSDLSDQATEATSSNLLEAMDLLADYSRRWKILSFSGPGAKASHQQSLSQLTADDVPLLEAVYTGDMNLFSDIHLLFPPGPWNNNIPQTGIPRTTPMADLMSKMHSLRSLHLQQGSISTLGIPLGWSQLTDLSFDFQPLDNSNPSPCVPLQTIAQTCRSLIVLTFRAYLPGFLGETGSDPVIWTSLRELNISLDGSICDFTIPENEPHITGPYSFLPHLKTIYGSIIAPQLLSLSIQLGHRRLGCPVASDDTLPFHMLVKGSPRLTNLRICGYHILKPEALAQCLQSSSSLKTLVLQPDHFPVRRRAEGASYRMSEEVIFPTPDWVPRMLSSLSSLDQCPQLELLDVGRCGETNNLSSILEFVQTESRITSLKHIKADMGELWGEQTLVMTSNESLIERLRAVHGISVDFKWKQVDPPSLYHWSRDPHVGLPDHTYDFIPYS